jgi:hypothetical protein
VYRCEKNAREERNIAVNKILNKGTLSEKEKPSQIMSLPEVAQL